MQFFSICIFIFIATTSSAQEHDSVPLGSTVVPVKLNPRFSFWTDFSLARSYRKISSPYYDAMISCRNHCEHPVYLPQLSIFFCDSVSKHFQFTCGIRLLQMGFRLKEDLILHDTLDHEYGAACNVYGMWDPYRGAVWNAFTDPRYNFLIVGYHSAHATIKIDVTYMYLDFPFEARLVFSRNRNSFFISSGMSASYLLHQRLVETFNYENGDSGSDDEKQIRTGYLDRWNASALAGIGFRHWTKTKQHSFELHFGIQQQLFNTFNQHSSSVAGYNEKHFNYTSGFTDYYFLRKRVKHHP